MSAYTLVLSWPLLAIPMLGVSLLVVFLPVESAHYSLPTLINEGITKSLG